MKIFTLGNGFIANHLNYPFIKDKLFPDYRSIETILANYNPNILINCIGYCGDPNIDQCENNKQKTIDANILIPSILSNICEKKQIKLIYIGSGCIFDGASPHSSYYYVNELKNNTGLYPKRAGITIISL